MAHWKELSFGHFKAETKEEQNRLFERKGFVETPLYQRMEKSRASIILGRKGSGKTAHVKAFLRHNKDFSRIVDEIVLQDFAPKQFFSILKEINAKLQIEDYQLTRNLWVLCIALRIMQAIRSIPRRTINFDNEGRKAVEHISEYLDKQGFNGALMPNGTPRLPKIELVASRERAQIEQFLKEFEITEAASNFATDHHFQAAFDSLKLILQRLNGALVVIDDLDAVIEHSNYESMTIFTRGLVEAVDLFNDWDNSDRGIKVKVLIPEDLFQRVRYRHLDKVSTESLSWNSTFLQEMLCRYAANDLCMKIDRATLPSDTIKNVFSRIFEGWPTAHTSTVYDEWGTARDAVQYIIMHTLNRPRDVIWMMQHILNHAHEVSQGGQTLEYLPPAVVKAGVAKASEKLVEQISMEYAQRFPELQTVWKWFARKKASMSFAEFEEILDGHWQSIAGVYGYSRERLPQDLYELGFFGKFVAQTGNGLSTTPIGSPDARTYVQFSYANSNFNPEADDLILIHPIFWSRLQLARSEHNVKGFSQPSGL
jgi:hypothetical protein